MNEIIEKEKLENMTHNIRERKVILVRDLAKLYNIETKVLNQTIKRNIILFNENDYFQMLDSEFNIWKSQNVTSKNDKTGLRTLPFVLTKNGILILSNLIKKEDIQKINLQLIKILDEKNEVSIYDFSQENKGKIEDLIFEVRGKQVMIDRDVALLYNVEAKRINEVVKRNINRFPEEFCFQLTENEIANLLQWSQFATASNINISKFRNIKYLPYVFTEYGIMMLSGLLKSDIAVKVNIQIINAFVKMRRYFVNNLDNNEMLINHENRILKLENTFTELKTKEEINKIFFEGQIYDAYSLLLDILNEANQEIIIIDNYAGKELLDILKNICKKIIIVSKNIDNKLKEKYELQYSNITFKNNNSFHDRYIIIDRNKLYSCGSSFKDLGKKCFSISKNNIKEYLEELLKIIN